ncbi:MAG: methylated-DNA--[protein]-cysteine S-methyltransferase [Eubacteriaceae bacterium]|nr:methylated-DNA--[protein]-cysteine S-methyltransferase [Eubacteriaceae bacterium]
MMGRQCIFSPVGWLRIISEKGFLTAIDFIEAEEPSFPDEITEKTAEELREYFEGKRRAFDIPVRIEGSRFFKKVLEQTALIPYAETVSYSQLAENSGNAKASRAVGGAMHANPIPIIIPCHRVIGKNNSLTGYGGGLEIKKILLKLESDNSV